MIARVLEWLRGLQNFRTMRPIRVACVQPLAAGVTIYAIDIDGRRIVIGTSSRAFCVLDCYPHASEQSGNSEGAGSAGA
jgi:hypothetical protein